MRKLPGENPWRHGESQPASAVSGIPAVPDMFEETTLHVPLLVGVAWRKPKEIPNNLRLQTYGPSNLGCSNRPDWRRSWCVRILFPRSWHIELCVEWNYALKLFYAIKSRGSLIHSNRELELWLYMAFIARHFKFILEEDVSQVFK